MRIAVCLFVFAGFMLVAPPAVEASKQNPGIAKPASKPPVYKKFDNRKKKSKLVIGPKSRN